MKLHVAKLHDSILEAIEEHDREIVERMVDYLFLTEPSMLHDGQRVERLVLVTKDGKDLGGWGKQPLTDRLIELIAPRIKKSRAD